MLDKIIYRAEKGSQLTSNEVDNNFRFLAQQVDKLANKDFIVYDAGYAKSRNQITINAGSKWQIAGEDLENTIDFVFDITPADYYRVDVIIATDKAEFEVLQGVDVIEGYTMPVVQKGLPYLYVYVSAKGIESIGSDANQDNVSKLSYSWTQMELEGTTVAVSETARNVEIIGGNRYTGSLPNVIDSFAFIGSFVDGFEVCIRNHKTDYITIVHNAPMLVPIKLYTLANYYLRPGETIVLKYIERDNCFVVYGALDIQLSWQNIDDIIGTDSLTLYIDSSEGDLIDATNMTTTLTASVERYFKDYTRNVVSWQWFRESGTAQEDQDSDAIWSLDKNKKVLALTAVDFTANIYNRSITFICQAIVEGQELTAKMQVG